MSYHLQLPIIHTSEFGQVYLRGAAEVFRQKLNGPLTHYGVALELVDVFGGSAWRVLDLQPEGPRLVEVGVFAAGRPFGSGQLITNPARLHRIATRAARASQAGVPFHLMEHNCEHFARYVLQGVKRSVQSEKTQIVAAAAGVGMLFWLILA